MDLQNVVILVTTNRGLKKPTGIALERCRAAGAALFQVEAGSDVTLARNIALSAVWRAFKEGKLTREPEVLLLVDDDMVFELAAVRALARHAVEHGEPASAMYATTASTLAATRCVEFPGYWLTGLGLLAVPWSLFAFLVSESKRFTMGVEGLEQWAFTSSQWAPASDGDETKPGQWMSEDYTFCRRLGGVRLLPIPAGHVKEVPLWPDQETIDKVSANAPLEQYSEGTKLPAIVAKLEVTP